MTGLTEVKGLTEVVVGLTEVEVKPKRTPKLKGWKIGKRLMKCRKPFEK